MQGRQDSRAVNRPWFTDGLLYLGGSVVLLLMLLPESFVWLSVPSMVALTVVAVRLRPVSRRPWRSIHPLLWILAVATFGMFSLVLLALQVEWGPARAALNAGWLPLVASLLGIVLVVGVVLQEFIRGTVSKLELGIFALGLLVVVVALAVGFPNAGPAALLLMALLSLLAGAWSLSLRRRTQRRDSTP